MPGVFRMDGLSALGLNSCCLFAAEIIGFWFGSVTTARAEKNVAAGSAPPPGSAGAAGGANVLLLGGGRCSWVFGVCGGGGL